MLIEHPAVAEAAVVPAPDELRLAVPKAYVALAPGHDPNEDTAFEILRYAREQAGSEPKREWRDDQLSERRQPPADRPDGA